MADLKEQNFHEVNTNLWMVFMFKSGQISVDDIECSDRLSPSRTDENVENMQQVIQEGT